MRRFKVKIEFDGRPYVGWQRQDNGKSVQGSIVDALFEISGERVVVTGAGRTDAGVHARGMVADFALEMDIDAHNIRKAINAVLRPHPIAIIESEEVDLDFSARFSCIRRSYEYKIINRYHPLTLEEGLVWRVGPALDVDLMRQGAKHMLGRHDFTSFRSTRCQSKSPIKSIEKIEIERDGPNITIGVTAQSFLHHQVRTIVGSLVYVGRKKEPVDWIKSAIEARDRMAAGPNAPANGLYFISAEY